MLSKMDGNESRVIDTATTKINAPKLSLRKYRIYAQVKMPSNNARMFALECVLTISVTEEIIVRTVTTLKTLERIMLNKLQQINTPNTKKVAKSLGFPNIEIGTLAKGLCRN
jgi:hypothetical protein